MVVSGSRAMELTPEERDGILEVGNIGTGQASGYLSELVGERVELAVPYVDIVSFSDAVSPVPVQEGQHVNVRLATRGVEGSIVLDFPVESGVRFLNRVDGTDGDALDAEGRERLREVGEGVAERFMQAIDQFLTLDLDVGGGEVSTEQPSTLLNRIATEDGGSEALLIATPFTIDTDVEGQLLLLITAEDAEKLVDALDAML